MRVALFVGPQCQHSLRVPDDLPLPDDAALRVYARLQFTHYFGAAAQQWPLAAAGRVACALSEGQVAALQATALSHRVRLVSLRPSWTLAPALDGDTAVLDGSMLTWLRQSGGLLRELQQRHVGDELLQELQVDRAVHASDLLSQDGGQPGPDFIAHPSPARRLMWAWAATAAAACALLAAQALEQHDEGQRLAEQATVLARIDRAAARATSPQPAPNLAARQRAWAVADQLNTDWPALWSTVERALPPGVQLNALDLGRQVLRLEGQAAEAEAVTRLVDRLTLAAQPGQEVMLNRLQLADGPADSGLRFELSRRAGGTP